MYLQVNNFTNPVLGHWSGQCNDQNQGSPEVYFFDTGNQLSMAQEHEIHVPRVNEIYLGQGTIRTRGDRLKMADYC